MRRCSPWSSPMDRRITRRVCINIAFFCGRDLLEDPRVFALTRDIEQLLGVAAGSWFGIVSDVVVTPELQREEAQRLVAEVRRMVAVPSFQRELARIRGERPDGAQEADRYLG